MVYINSWQEYQDAAEALYKSSPNKTRYCVKWKSSEGKLVLKITDDVKCIKFKTFSSIFLNRFEALNLSLIQKMQNQRTQSISPPHSSQSIPPVHTPSSMPISGSIFARASTPTTATAPMRATTPTSAALTAPGAASASAGGVKKKKPKKKK